MPEPTVVHLMLARAMELERAVRRWVVDSGASEHIATHLADFSSYAPLVPRQTIHLAKNSIVEAVGIGAVSLSITNNASQLSQWIV